MRIFLILLLLLSFATPSLAAEKDGRKVLYWYDPMVPGQKFDKPGKSPYMDMDLVPFYEGDAADKPDAPAGAVKITAVYRQALGVKTAPAKMETFGKTITAPGAVVPDTRLEYAVSVRTAGWIADLRASAIGDSVKKGDLLFTFYSPDLMTAQSDYLLGNRVGNAERRLRLYGMDEKAIAGLKTAGKFMEQTPFYAPADGVVSALNVRKGAYVETDGEKNAVMTLQDYSRVWVEAQASVKDLQFLTAGTPASVTVDETGKTYQSVIDIIYPTADPASRKGLVRLVLDNADGSLKTGSLVTVRFTAEGQSRLAVPAQSVLYGKDGGHVIEDTGDGYFRPVPVKTGITANGLTEILSGLKEGQSVVMSGQFMIDAESALSGGTGGMEGSHE